MRSPVLLDPFAGGGAIPLEASRLGCQPIANDYNPVAYLILRATCEFPQRYGKRLVDDVERWAKWILERAHERIGHLYPPGDDGNPVVGYLWARTAPCSNPTCRAEIPLLRSLLVCKKSNKRVALTMDIQDKEITFGIAKGKDITRTEGTMIEKGRGSARCPFCHQVVPVGDLKRSSLEGKFGERIVAVILNTPHGKDYRPVEPTELEAFEESVRLAGAVERPSEPMPVEYTQALPSCTWGFTRWGDLFNPRQLLAMQTFGTCLHDALAELEQHEPDAEYRKAVVGYLGLWIDRIAMRCSNVGIWHTTGEKVEHPFGRQAIPMVWDYPETNPFNEVTGGALGQIDWILRVIAHESPSPDLSFPSASVLCGDGARLPLADNASDVVVTDPPERADGRPVEVPELLELARVSALKAIAGEFQGDALSRLYFVWANLYGASEQAWDDARLVVQIGGESEDAMEVAKGHGLFVVDGSRCRLALLNDRAKRRNLGEASDSPFFLDNHKRRRLLHKASNLTRRQ